MKFDGWVTDHGVKKSANIYQHRDTIFFLALPEFITRLLANQFRLQRYIWSRRPYQISSKILDD